MILAGYAVLTHAVPMPRGRAAVDLQVCEPQGEGCSLKARTLHVYPSISSNATLSVH